MADIHVFFICIFITECERLKRKFAVTVVLLLNLHFTAIIAIIAINVFNSSPISMKLFGIITWYVYNILLCETTNVFWTELKLFYMSKRT